MSTRPAAFNDNGADAGGAPAHVPANDNGRRVRPVASIVVVRGPSPRSSAWPTFRAAALVARAVSDGTPTLAVAIYAGLAALSIGAFLFAG